MKTFFLKWLRHKAIRKYGGFVKIVDTHGMLPYIHEMETNADVLFAEYQKRKTKRPSKKMVFYFGTGDRT